MHNSKAYLKRQNLQVFAAIILKRFGQVRCSLKNHWEDNWSKWIIELYSNLVNNLNFITNMEN